MNIELLHSARSSDLFMAGGQGDPEVDEATAWRRWHGNPEGVMMLAKALDHLTRASKSDLEFVGKIEARVAERTKREAVAAVDKVAKAQGLSPDTAGSQSGKGILGVAA